MQTMIESFALLTVDGARFPSFLCTPEHLDELAVGFLITQGYVHTADDIASVRVDGLSVAVSTHAGVMAPQPLPERMDSLRPVRPKRGFTMPEAVALMRELAEVEVYFGTHCLALLTPETLHFREDIGRHNAMDKVIGRGAMDRVDFAACVAAATGRISFEMLLKAAAVGIPYIVSRKYPSDLSIQTAEKLRICIVGKALSPTPIVYSVQENLRKSRE